jgi:hypothetical protein
MVRKTCHTTPVDSHSPVFSFVAAVSKTVAQSRLKLSLFIAILALGVSVHAQSSSSGNISVLTYGADPSGVQDSTAAFQSAATAATNQNGTLYVPAGTYKVNSPIEVGSSLEMDDSAVVKATAPMSAVIRVGSNNFVYDEVYSGGKIEANNLAQDGIIFRQYQHVLVEKIVVSNALANGFHFGDSSLGTSSYEAVAHGIYTKRDPASTLQPGSTGVFVDSNATDNSISQGIFVSSDIGVKVMTGGNFFTDIHVWALPSSGTMSVGFDDFANGNFWKGCEADTVSTYGLHARAFNTVVEGCRFYNNSGGSDNAVVGIRFDQSAPGASVTSNIFFGYDSSHRLAADMSGANSSVSSNANQCINVASLSTATGSSTGQLYVNGTVTSTGTMYSANFASLAAAASSSQNTTTSMSLGANYFSGSTSTSYSWNLSPSQSSSGTPSSVDLSLFLKGTIPSGVNPRLILNAPSVATSSTPVPSVQEVFQSSYLNSSNVGAYDSWGIQNVLGTGTNPSSTLAFTHWGTGGTAAVSVPSLIVKGETLNGAPRLTWTSFGTCATNVNNCQESALWTPTRGIVIDQWQFTVMTPPAGCSWYPTLSLKQGSTTLASIKLAAGVSNYTNGTTSIAVSSANGPLSLAITSAATGCSTYASGIASSLEYVMQ